MIKVGLTGGIATGKSTVSAMFKKAGFHIIDADEVSKEVLDLNPEILERVKKNFGEGFFDEKGTLKRKEFGNHIFKHQSERIKYEAIIMPYIKERINLLFDEHKNTGVSVVILDAPTLIENNMQEEMDYNILVWSEKNIQISRLKSRNGYNESEALDRINSQMPLEEKKKFVNFIVDNSKTIKDTESQVQEIISFLEMYN